MCKKAILIVSFGSTYAETRKKNIDRVADCIRERFPKYLVLQAFSSEKIRRIIKDREGCIIPSVSEAVCELHEQGVTHLYVLPTHIIDGIESHRLREILNEKRELFERLETAQVLLSGSRDYELAVRAVLEELKPKEKDIVMFVGHGTLHRADESYQRLEKSCEEIHGKRSYVVTVEGSATIESAIERLKRDKAWDSRILLTPFMLVAGEHARRDIAGEQDSIQSRLREEGFKTEMVFKGLGEYAGIRRLYLEHLLAVMD